MESHHPLNHQLDTLLNDSEGVQLFHKFLTSSFSSGHLLDFWFACKGFRSIVDGDDQLKLLQVAKAIYRTYIKTGASLSVPVNDTTKREIRSTLAAFSHSYHNPIGGDKRFPVLRSLFDAAQADIQSLLARSYFLEFLQSDSFRMIHQSLASLECSACPPSKNHHACSDQTDNLKRSTFSAKSTSQQCRSQSGSAEGTSIPTTDVAEQNLTPVLTDQPSCDVGSCGPANRPKASTFGTISSDKSRRTTTESGGAREMVTASELIAYMNPGVCGGGGGGGGGGGSGSGDPASSSTQNKPPQAAASDVPTRKPGTNLAEVDPSAFAQTLSHRLEKVKESRGKMERLLSRMQPIDPEDASGEDAELASIHAGVNQPPSPPLPARSTRLSSACRRATSAASGDLLRKKLSALLLPSGSGVGVPPADDAQVILEDHCSRIWTDERRGQPLNVCRKGGRRSDVYSISSFDSGVGTYGGGGGGLNSSDSESCVSRGGPFYHQYRWNYAPPPLPPVCSFCRRTPSMSSTPAAHRKDVMSSGSSCRWGVQYQRVQYHHGHSHHYNLEEVDCCGGGGGRTMRSRSLTSDSPSVFDSGLSSTYDHLPTPRRSRHDDHKLTQQPVEGTTPTFSGRPTPLSGDDINHRLPGECNPGRNATPAALTTSLDLFNSGHLPSTKQERQKLPHQSIQPATNAASGCAQNTLLKTNPTYSPFSPQQPGPLPTCSLVVGYYLCDDPVPYRTVWTGPLASEAPAVGAAGGAASSRSPSITLGQFKQLVAKKGVYRYFFKTASDEFGTGCVNEEVGDDNAILPLWEGKVIARVERAD